MRPVADFSRPCGLSVTDAGREAIEVAERCLCEQLLVIDGAYQCTECGTIFGLVYGWNKPPKRTHWRRSWAS